MSYRTALIDGSGFAKAAYVPGKRQLAHRFLGRVFQLMERERKAEITVCWDPEDNVSERVSRFADYKANRRREPDSFDENYLEELRELFRVLPLLGVTQAWADGWEADDVLATLARTAPEPVLVLTRDGDLVQLVRERVHVLMRRNGRDKVYTPAVVLKEKGISAETFTDWKALAGDSGDGVPGMPGVGEKTATEILSAYPTFVRSVLNLDEIVPPELTKRTLNILWKVTKDPERLRTMRWLVELHDVPVTVRRAALDAEAAEAELRRMGLRVGAMRAREILNG